MEFSTVRQIPYTIAGSSEHSGKYVAENILVDKPEEQSSRWSGAYQAGNVKQWILLKTTDTCVLKSITFGKFHRAHPCNMKEFKLYVGLTESNMTEILHAGLKNDPIPEEFNLPHSNTSGIPFPTRFVKIVPLSAHGQSFHTSIWYIALRGIIEASFVNDVQSKHEQHQETVIFRHILKHLRQRRLLTPYQNLLDHAFLVDPSRSLPLSDPFEHPLLGELHKTLVIQGNFSHSEVLISSCADNGLLSDAIHQFQPCAEWLQIDKESSPADTMDLDPGVNVNPSKPSPRGGHSMCLDQTAGMIYMFGGWDGRKSLDDFWVWNVSEGRWTLISVGQGASEQVHPGARACHKMVFDDNTGDIYLLGRLDERVSGPPVAHPAMSVHAPSPPSSDAGEVELSREPSAEPQSALPTGASSSSAFTWGAAFSSEFFRYKTRGERAGTWELLSRNTALESGPPLIFDHQMVIDPLNRAIYVYGGRVVDGNWNSIKYSGLFCYDIKENQWSALPCPDSPNIHPCIPSRFGHSMVFEPSSQTLLIFGGQRNDGYLADMYAYHIPTTSITELFFNFSTAGGPDACFTQRAVIDPELREVYVLCGLTRGPAGALSTLEKDSPYWIYQYKHLNRPGKWTRIPSSSESEDSAPLPRYAHQIVYDNRTKLVYMHGGNAGLKDEILVAPNGDWVGVNDPDRLHGQAADVGHQQTQQSATSEEENRLNDFWTLKLRRLESREIVRQGKFLVRQQRYKEMCEDDEPVKALGYLKSEVSAVVDHSNAEEATLFRSLLSHLIAPSPLTTSSTSSVGMRRSRYDTPSPTDDEDMVVVESDSPEQGVGSNPRPRLRLYEEDTSEADIRGEMSSPSKLRYKQRTLVFEQLLKFVNEEMKQPESNLLDLINIDQISGQF